MEGRAAVEGEASLCLWLLCLVSYNNCTPNRCTPTRSSIEYQQLSGSAPRLTGLVERLVAFFTCCRMVRSIENKQEMLDPMQAT